MGLLDRMRGSLEPFPDQVYCAHCGWGNHFTSNCPKVCNTCGGSHSSNHCTQYHPTIPITNQTLAKLHDSMEDILDAIWRCTKEWNDDERKFGYSSLRGSRVNKGLDNEPHAVLQSAASRHRRPSKMRVHLKNGNYYEVDDEIKGILIFDESNGWRNIGRVVDLAVQNDMEISDEDSQRLARYLDDGGEDNDAEIIQELSDEAENYLTDQVIEDGWSFGWYDGNFYLGHKDWWSTND